MPGDSSPPTRVPGQLTITLLIGLLCCIWGSTWLVIREGLEDLPPFTSAAVRFVIAAVTMALLSLRLARLEGGERPGRSLVLVMGLLNFFVSYAIVYWSETVLPSGLVSVLWAAFPLMMAFLSHVYLPGERLKGGPWAGFVAGFLGIALLFATDLRRLGPAAIPAGLILLISPAVSSIGNMWVKLHGARVSSILLNRDGLALGAAGLCVLAFIVEDPTEVTWTTAGVLSVGYLSLIGTVTAFGLYFWLLRHAPAYQLSLIAYITPLIALVLGATLGGEPVGGLTMIGTAAILSGVALVLAGRRRRAVAPTPAASVLREPCPRTPGAGSPPGDASP